MTHRLFIKSFVYDLLLYRTYYRVAPAPPRPAGGAPRGGREPGPRPAAPAPAAPRRRPGPRVIPRASRRGVSGRTCSPASRARASKFQKQKERKTNMRRPVQTESRDSPHRAQTVSHTLTQLTARQDTTSTVICVTRSKPCADRHKNKPPVLPSDPSRPPVSPTPSHDAQPRPRSHGAGGHRASHPAARGRGHQAALVLTSLPTTVVGSASASLSLAELISALISSAEAK